MSVDQKHRLQAYRETMPFLVTLNESIQKDTGIPSGSQKQLYEISKTLEPSGDDESKKRWDAIVGSPDYGWYNSSYVSSSDYPKIKKFSSMLLNYVKNVIDAEKIRESSDSITQLTEELSILRTKLSEVLDKLAVHLPSEEKFELISQKVMELNNKLGQVENKITRQSMSSESKESKINQIDKLLQDTRKEIEELRKQHTALLDLLVKAEKPKKVEN